MKTLLLILCIFSTSLLVQSQVPTKSLEDYGVKYTVAEKVPEQLIFLMGTYKDGASNKTIQLKNDGTLSLDGKIFNYWFECTDDNFIATMPYFDSYSKIIPTAQQSKYSQINLIVEAPYKQQSSFTIDNKTYRSKDFKIINFQIWRAVISIDKKMAFLDGMYSKVINGNTQQYNTITKNGFLAPLSGDLKAMCDCISIHEKPTLADREHFDYGFEKRLMDFAGADVTKESRESATDKISRWWDKYKTLFRCNTMSFNLEYGSILKFAVAHGYAPFLETIVGTYQMDINYIDPVDNRNMLDYVNDDLQKAIKTQGETHSLVKVLKEYKELLENLGCTPSKK